jgi:undecaprenyl-diphosphatase
MGKRNALMKSRAAINGVAISPSMRREAPLFTRGRTGLTVIGVALTTFAILYGIVRKNRSAAADAAITLRMQKQDHPVFDRLMRIVSWAGFPPQSRILPPAIALAIALLGYPLEAIFQFLGWGTGGISFLVKRSMRRARPSANETRIRVVAANIGGSSFPSGHVLNYLGVYGFLAYLVHTWVRPVGLRRVLRGALIAMIGLVGPSRVYLGHHWFTDVLASYLLGTSYLIALITVYRKVKLFLLRVRGQ